MSVQNPDRVVIFDTTLRDGEQSPGISLDQSEKLEIAEQLARLGVDIIEAGFPIASQGDFEAVQVIAKAVQGPVICGLSRTAHKDIDRCWEAIEAAGRRRIHVFIATSETHMRHKLRMTPEQVKAESASAVARARGYTDDVEFSPEDASRSDFDFMCEVLQVAADNGATTLNIPDTVGYGVPEEYAEKLRRIRRQVSGDYLLSTHCHNDLGLAVANSLSGVLAGARQVECAINGIGERAGNAALEEIVMAVKTRDDFFGGLEVGIRTEELHKTSRLVSRLTGYPVQYNKAVVGRNAFAHEARHPPARRAQRAHHLRDHGPAGGGPGGQPDRAGQALGPPRLPPIVLLSLGLDIKGDALNAAFTRFKELADRKIELTDADLEAIVADEVGQRGGARLRPAGPWNATAAASAPATPSATVVVKVNGELRTAREEGNGMVDAACKAVKAATGVEGPPHRLQRHVGDRRRGRPRRRCAALRVHRRCAGGGKGALQRRGGGLGPRLREPPSTRWRGSGTPARTPTPWTAPAASSWPSGCPAPRRCRPRGRSRVLVPQAAFEDLSPGCPLGRASTTRTTLGTL